MGRKLYKEFGLKDEDELTGIIVVLLAVLLAFLLIFQRSCNTGTIDLVAEARPVADTPLVQDGFEGGRVTFTGDGEPDQTLNVYLDGVKVGTTSTNSRGDWSYATDVTQTGDHTLELRDPTEDGGVLRSPIYPFLVGAGAVAAADQGLLVDLVDVDAEDGEGAVTVNGRSTPYCKLDVLVDNVLAGTTTADNNGDWEFTTRVTEAGEHDVKVRCNENNGSTELSQAFPFVIGAGAAKAVQEVAALGDGDDEEATAEPTAEPTEVPAEPTEAPAEPTEVPTEIPTEVPTEAPAEVPTEVPAPAIDAPVISSIGMADGSGDTAVVDGDSITTEPATLPISGEGTPGSTVTVLVDGVEAGTASVGEDGTWQVDVPFDTEGEYAVTAQTADNDGNPLGDSDLAVTVLPVAVVGAPVISSVGAADGSDTAVTDGDSITTEPATLPISGEGTPGSTVTVLVDGVEAGTATVGEDGTWQVDVPFDTEGEYAVLAQTADNDGNPLGESTLAVTVLPAAEPEPGTLTVALSTEPDADILPGLPTTELILDASWSMTFPPESNEEIDRLTADDPASRIGIARESLTEVIQNVLPAGAPVALRAFGNIEGFLACRTDLMQEVAPLDRDSLDGLVVGISPQFNANTAIAAALAQVPSDLAEVEGKKIIILLTDGQETCGGDPAAEIQGLVDAGFDVQVNIVGFAIADDELRGEFEGWAAIGGGEYYDAGDTDELKAALNTVFSLGYEVTDADGAVVASGAVNGDAVSVPPGTYTVSIDTDPAFVIEEVTIEAGAALELQPGE